MGQNNFIVNGRTVVHADSGGSAKASSVNYTGEKKLPVSYQVKAESNQLENLAHGLTVEGNPVATIDSFTNSCSGDEAGDGGGIHSGTIGGRSEFLSASPDTLVSDSSFMVDGKPVVREGDMFILNHRNSAITTWQQDKGQQSQSDSRFALPAPETATPYLIDLTVLGPKANSAQQYFALYKNQAEQPNQLLLCSQYSDDENEYWRRLSFHHLENESYQLKLYMPTNQGEPIGIPLPSTQKPCSKDDSKPDYHGEKNCFVPVILSNHLFNETTKFQPKAGDLSDILKLSDSLREQVYSELIHHQLSGEQCAFVHEEQKPSSFFSRNTMKKEGLSHYRLSEKSEESPGAEPKRIKDFNKSWYDIISPSLRYKVDHYLQDRKTRGGIRKGYLYLFLNNGLWREIEITTAGQLKEIDLSKNAENDIRPASGLTNSQVYLPNSVGGEPIKIEMAFSDLQWSWARINFFGGINKELYPNVSESVINSSQALEHREQRFTAIDLKAYVKNQPDKQLTKQGYLAHALCPKKNIPILYLPDPILPIQSGIVDIHFLISKLEEVVELIAQEPYYMTAMMTYRYFFDERSAHNLPLSEGEKQKQSFEFETEFDKRFGNYIFAPDYLRKLAKQYYPDEHWDNLDDKTLYNQFHERFESDTKRNEHARLMKEGKPNELKALEKHIDLSRLRNALKVDLRQRIREMIRLIQQTTIALMDASHPALAVTSIGSPLAKQCFIPYYHYLRDLFSLNIYRYDEGYIRLNAIMTSLCIEPAQIDQELDIQRDFDASTSNPGQRFVQKLLEESHPLHPIIFANDKAIKAAEPVDYESDFEQAPNDGSGNFCGLRYAQCWALLDKLSMMKFVNNSSDLIHEMINSLAQNILNATANASDELMEKGFRQIDKLMQATNHPVLSVVMRKENIDISNSEQLIIGLYQGKEGLGSSNVRSFDEFKSKNQSSHANMYDVSISKEGMAMVSQSLKNQTIYEFDAKGPRDALHNYQQKTKYSPSPLKRERLIIKSPMYVLKSEPTLTWENINKPPNPEQQEWPHSLKQVFDKSKGVLKKNAVTINRSVTSIMAVYSAVNLHNALYEFTKEIDNNSTQKIDFLQVSNVFINFMFSSGLLVEAIIGTSKLENWTSQHLFTIDGKFFKLTALNTIGIFSLSVNLSLNAFNLISSIEDMQHKDMFYRCILSLTGLGSIFSLLGSGVKKKIELEASKLVTSQGLLMKEAINDVKKQLLLRQGLKFSVLRLTFLFSGSAFGLIFIVSDLVISLLYDLYRDKPLAQWVKTSSFSIYKNKAKTTDFDMASQLMEILFSPSSSISKAESDNHQRVKLSIQLPYFIPGKHQLELRSFITSNDHQYVFSGQPQPALINERIESHELQPTQVDYFIKNDNILNQIDIYFYLDKSSHKLSQSEGYHMGGWKDKEISCFYRLLLENDIAVPGANTHKDNDTDVGSAVLYNENYWFKETIIT